MKTLHKIFLTPIFLLFCTVAFSQTNNEKAKALVKEGIALHDQGKYDEAVDKYNQAIKLDSGYENAYYEMGYTLFAQGKEKEAIPFLEKLIVLEPGAAAGFDMLGSIYDDLKQPDKAMDYYQKGIKANPEYQRLHFNLAVAYYRQGKYPEAEAYAINAIKLDPKHASSLRVYALTTYKENKRGCSLLAWCSFLLLEPQTKRSADAFKYLKNIANNGYIINYGIKKGDEKNLKDTTEHKPNLSPVDSLELQLTALFRSSKTLTGDKEQSVIVNYFGDYFEKLGNSGNMPAFARFISQSAYKEETLRWFKENDKQLTALNDWIAATKREF